MGYHCIAIPDNCRRRGRRRQCKFFWPVSIFTDLTRKIGIFDRFYAKKWRFFTDLTQKIGVFRCKFILQKFCPCKKMTNIRYGITLQSSLVQGSRDGHEGVEVCASHLLGCQLNHGLGSQQGLAPEPVEGVGGGGGGWKDVPVVGVHAVPHLHSRLDLLLLSHQAVRLQSLQAVHATSAPTEHKAEPLDVVVLGHRGVVHPALAHVHPRHAAHHHHHHHRRQQLHLEQGAPGRADHSATELLLFNCPSQDSPC